MRSETLDQRLPVVAGLPAAAVQLDGGVEVLGDSLGGDPPDFHKGRPPDHRCGPTPEHTVVAILAGQDHLEEHALVVASGLEMLERVVIAEVVRGLHHGHGGVAEVAHRGVEYVGLWDMVGIEDQEQLGIDHFQGVVDVPRLGVTIVGSCEVTGARPLRQNPNGLPAAVVEHPGRMRVGDPGTTKKRGLEDVQSLVVGTDQYLHAVRPVNRRSLRNRYPPSQEAERDKHRPPEELTGVQEKEQRRLRPFPRVDGPPAEVGRAPHESDDRNAPDDRFVIDRAHPYRQGGVGFWSSEMKSTSSPSG